MIAALYARACPAASEAATPVRLPTPLNVGRQVVEDRRKIRAQQTDAHPDGSTSAF